MSSTNFVDQQTVVVAAWLNDVNDAIYTAIGDGTTAPTSAAEVKANLGISSITGSIVLKGNGSGGITNATAGVDFASAAQGTLADTAVQPAAIVNMLETGDIGVSVQAYDADTAKTDVAQTFTASQRGTVTTDNDGSFDMSVTNNFKCTLTGTVALTFTNITAGQSGYVLLINSSGYAITAAATTKLGATTLSTVSAAGTYLMSYFTDGTNVYVTSSGALS